MQFVREHLSREEVFNKDILEVGAQDVNGSPREVIASLGPRAYYGVDFGPGKGVDLVLDVKHLLTHFGKDRFDVVISTEMLEHAEDWKTAVNQMKAVLRPGGILILTARGPGFPYHGFPHDYWRFTVKDCERIFSDMTSVVVLEDISPGVLVRAIKTTETGKLDLSDIPIEPMTPPPEILKRTSAKDRVDILVATWNTLPWLKLLVSQMRRFRPEIEVRLLVWDNGSRDGTHAWLEKNDIFHIVSVDRKSHAQSLNSLLELSDAPYIAFMDVDAFPIQHGWLDDAVAALKDGTIGAAGLLSQNEGSAHRPFVHPAFCVFRRDLYRKLDLKPDIVYTAETALDVGESMCAKMEDAGYPLRFLGFNQLDVEDRGRWVNKVVHALSSTPVLSENRLDKPFLDMVSAVSKWHLWLLSALGLSDEFKTYAREVFPFNQKCGRYLPEAPRIPLDEIRFSIIIPTIGRPNLYTTLHSILSCGLLATDEVIVVGDGSCSEAEKIVGFYSERMNVRFYAGPETHIFGAKQRNLGMSIATGSHLLFMDDDDTYKPGALNCVRVALAEAPRKLHLFRIESISKRHPFGILWSEKEMTIGNVGTQMIAVPRVQELLGVWPDQHCSDFGFLMNTAPKFKEGEIVWREEVIAELH